MAYKYLNDEGLKALVKKIKSYVSGLLPTQKVTWAELKALRDGGKLTAGRKYRITDFVTTSAQAETRSAGHAFDVIVTADDEKTLNENAHAAIHSGDTYFSDCKLNAWELKYSLDNDVERFTWADSKNGKGVVWWMKDEFNNECFYDFKNIQYKRYKVTSTHANTADLVSQMPYLGLPSNNSKGLSESDFSDFKYVYTFTKYASDGAVIEDASLIGVSVKDTYGCHSNHIGAFFSTEEVSKDVYANIRSLNNGVFYTNDGNNILCYGNTIGTGCYKFTCLHGMYESSCGNGCSSWTCGKGCHNWTCGDFCHGWTTGTDCSYWTCGNNCHSWSCGKLCDVWICGNNCHNWTCGDSCHGWSCGNSCYGWTCGNKGIAWSCGDQCYDWICGDECNTWKCGNFCHSWKCGNRCNSWTCGNNSYSWSCGNDCHSWNCGNSCSGWICGDYCTDWTCGHNCDNWTCEENCTNWVCGNGCDNWSCKKQCNSWVCGNECSEWKCDEFCSNWTCGDYCSNWKCDGWCVSWKCGNDSSGWYAGGASASWTCGNGCNNWKCGGNCQTWECGNGCSHWEVNVAQRGFRIESGVSGSKEQPLLIWIDGENKSETRKLIITTKRTEGASTSDDLVMYFADEVATQENVDSQISAKTVRYDKEQSLNDYQKQRARKNIGAGKPVESGTDISVENNKANIAITENITVAGLSDTYGCGLIKNGDTIPKGTSLSKILEMMLTKELMPAAATKPTISITKASVVSGLHEIGESVNVGTATISKTAGHFNNNGWASPAQPTAKFTWSGETMTSQLASGATGYVKQTGASIAQGTAKTVKGTNKVSITASANYSAPTNSPITNLGNTKTDAAYTWTASKASASTTITWTGVYPCFTNLGKLGTEPTVNLTLQTGATFNISVPSHNAGNNDFRFAYPDGWTILSFKVKSLDGKYYEFAADHNKNAGNLTKTIQGVSVTYHYLTVANGASDYQITLNKALNA